jgi:hypothetical protein
MMSDPEREAEAVRQFQNTIAVISAVCGSVLLTENGPVPMIPEGSEVKS